MPVQFAVSYDTPSPDSRGPSHRHPYLSFLFFLSYGTVLETCGRFGISTAKGLVFNALSECLEEGNKHERVY